MFDSVQWHGVDERVPRVAPPHSLRIAERIAAQVRAWRSDTLTAEELAAGAYALFLAEVPHLRQSGIGWRFLAFRDSPWPGWIRYPGASTSFGAYYHYGWNVAVAMCLVIEQTDSGVAIVRLVLNDDAMAEDRWARDVPAHAAPESVLRAAGDVAMLMWEDIERCQAMSRER